MEGAREALSEASDEQLIAELSRRGALPRCPCGKWGTKVSAWDQDGYTLRCCGCMKSIAKCRC